jgi:Lon protease-like protein
MIAPVFPLPNVVFFPHTFLPLHIFEPRYRAMVTDALKGERLIVMVLAHEVRPPGEVPSIHEVGSVGRIEVAEPLAEGRYNIALKGLARVVVGRLNAMPAKYFSAELEVLVEALPDLQDPEVAERKAGFLLTARRYAEQILGGDHPGGLLSDAVPYPMLVNRAATFLRVGVREKQALLCLDDLGERAAAVERWMNEQIDSRTAIERYAKRRPANPRVN